MRMPLEIHYPSTFLTGTNLPWIHYGIDFGANAWRPSGGIAQPDGSASVEAAISRLAGTGIRWVRWFLFCDGRAGIRFGADGRPHGLDESVFRDLDAALAIAQRHGVSIMWVLFDFLWCDALRVLRGVQMGGRARVLSDRTHRDALLECVLAPVLERYGNESTIFAWDVINEPEWITTVDPETVGSFVGSSVALVHSATRHPVTVGSAGVRWRHRYTNMGLDFYQVHWYDGLKHQPPLDTPVADLGFDRPVLLGEFPTRGSRRTPQDIVDAARAAGYCGALSWSALANDECSAGSGYSISSNAFTPVRMP
jgi:hypothetical protein